MHPANPVKTSPLGPPYQFAERFAAAGVKQGFQITTYGQIGPCPLIALTKCSPGVRPRIYLSSGIHGDEPAPPLALLELVEAGVFDARATWFICPLLNPAGLMTGIRENADGLDLNRDYKDLRSAEIRDHAGWLRRQPNFDLSICVHEDWEAQGFYLYELNPLGRSTLATSIIAHVAPVCPIETATVIDGREIAATGIIRPVSDPLMRENWPEAIYLRAHHTTLSYTLETPSGFPLAQRIAAHRAAIETALTLAIRDWHKTRANPPAAAP